MTQESKQYQLLLKQQERNLARIKNIQQSIAEDQLLEDRSKQQFEHIELDE